MYFLGRKGYFCVLMRHLYSLLISLFHVMLPVLGVFVKSLKEFYQVRRGIFKVLEEKLSAQDQTIWVHAASLGEYEQAVPVLEELRAKYKDYKIVLTFFSPSGYTVKKATPLADLVTYLPLDTKRNAQRFVKVVKPELAIFVKYEFWPNYLNTLQKLKVPTLLVSGVFRADQPFFKFYGRWMTQSLRAFDYFFLQNSSSLDQLQQLGFKNAEVSGDTRFDRVHRQLSYDNFLSEIERFKGADLLLVCGSTWPEDITLLSDFINTASGIKILIAPHKVDEDRIQELEQVLKRPSKRFSNLQSDKNYEANILIVDAIGFLSKIYAYADLAYVGGAAGTTGLHNILEPATFGVPIITGIHIEKFPEAQDLRTLAGLFTVANLEETTALLQKLTTDANFRLKTGIISGNFISNNTGATPKIMAYIDQTLTA